MSFKARLYITFITIIVLPVILSTIAFYIISIYLMHENAISGGAEVNYAFMSNAFLNTEVASEIICESIMEQASLNISAFEDIEYLEFVNQEIKYYNSYLVVKKEGELYYLGDNVVAKNIIKQLPVFGQALDDTSVRYFYPAMKKYVAQIDFYFADQSEGSIYIITKQAGVLSTTLIVDMVIAGLFILLFTSFMLTRWIQKGVIDPVKELNTAMKAIKNGNLEYRLENNLHGEMGELYANYEEMRLQLKESMEENELNEMQNREMISNISHDLKTPITAIKGYMEGLLDGVADTPEKVDRYVRTVYHKAKDMDKLIDELTVYSGIDNSKLAYNFHCMNVADYFSDCVEEVGLDLESKNIKLEYMNIATEDTKIIADPEQMKKVINNIISNSVKYKNEDESIIKIRILEDVESVTIEIEDNGKGIETKNLSNIFERFYRTDTSRNSAQGGSGIGLSIVKKIIEDHGGYVWATSKEDEFTCIHFVIRKYKEL